MAEFLLFIFAPIALSGIFVFVFFATEKLGNKNRFFKMVNDGMYNLLGNIGVISGATRYILWAFCIAVISMLVTLFALAVLVALLKHFFGISLIHSWVYGAVLSICLLIAYGVLRSALPDDYLTSGEWCVERVRAKAFCAVLGITYLLLEFFLILLCTNTDDVQSFSEIIMKLERLNNENDYFFLLHLIVTIFYGLWLIYSGLFGICNEFETNKQLNSLITEHRVNEIINKEKGLNKE